MDHRLFLNEIVFSHLYYDTRCHIKVPCSSSHSFVHSCSVTGKLTDSYTHSLPVLYTLIQTFVHPVSYILVPTLVHPVLYTLTQTFISCLIHLHSNMSVSYTLIPAFIHILSHTNSHSLLISFKHPFTSCLYKYSFTISYILSLLSHTYRLPHSFLQILINTRMH